MPKITFIQPDGTRHTIDAALGSTGMDIARDHNIRGLRGTCGGECLCCTCHCYVDEQWVGHLPPKNAQEASLIEWAWEPKSVSRLTCQLIITESLDGLVLHVPEQQL